MGWGLFDVEILGFTNRCQNDKTTTKNVVLLYDIMIIVT